MKYALKFLSSFLAAAPFAAYSQETALPPVLITAQKADVRSLAASDFDQAGLASRRLSSSDTARLLQDIAGVSMYGAGGVSSLPAIHGMGDDRVHVQVDGMAIMSACPNHMNSPLSYIDPTNVASIKVFAGITPVSVGGDSIGGTIQVNSAAPQFAQAEQGSIVNGQVGTFYRSNGDGYGANLAATYADENLNLTYNGSTAQSGNYTAARDFKRAGPAAAGQGWLGGDTVGSSSYKSENQELGFALRRDDHLLELQVDVQNIPYEDFPNQRMDMTANTDTHVNLRYTGQFGWGNLEARIFEQTTNHSMNFGADKQYWYGSAATLLAPGMPMNTDGKTIGASVKGNVALSERDILRIGGELQQYRLNDWWPPSPSVPPAGYTGMQGMGPNTFQNINDGKRDRIDVFAEWEARWSAQWLTQLGVRSGTVKMNTGTVHGYGMMYDAAPIYPATTFDNLDRQRTDHNWDLTALTRYTPSATQTYEAGYAQKTRSPNLYERYTWSTSSMATIMNNFAGDGNGYVGNLNLKPEVAHTLSATADWHDAANEQWDLKITPYYTHVTNYIDARRCPLAVCGNSASAVKNLSATTGFVNLQYANQSAQLYGIDISGHLLLANTGEYGSFTWTGVASYVRGENLTSGDNLYDIMPLDAKIAVEQRVGNWTNTAEAQLVAAKTNVSQVRNENQTGGYGLINLRSSYLWKQARFDIGVDNLFNKFYALPLGGAYVGQGATMGINSIPWGIQVPGMGRSINTALTVKF